MAVTHTTELAGLFDVGQESTDSDTADQNDSGDEEPKVKTLAKRFWAFMDKLDSVLTPFLTVLLLATNIYQLKKVIK